jgi:hypothetical protein
MSDPVGLLAITSSRTRGRPRWEETDTDDRASSTALGTPERQARDLERESTPSRRERRAQRRRETPYERRVSPSPQPKPESLQESPAHGEAPTSPSAAGVVPEREQDDVETDMEDEDL